MAGNPPNDPTPSFPRPRPPANIASTRARDDEPGYTPSLAVHLDDLDDHPDLAFSFEEVIAVRRTLTGDRIPLRAEWADVLRLDRIDAYTAILAAQMPALGLTPEGA